MSDIAWPSRFRALIVGRANAGKTSILKKLCSETDEPIVRDGNGNLVMDLESLTPTSGRGLHDIDHEITYPSNPGFVFHDSPGFEAGSVIEMEKISGFIRNRLGRTDEASLHIIWYCVPTDTHRAFPGAELRFFDINTEGVPVVVVFTKFDALETMVLECLTRHGHKPRQAMREMPNKAREVLQERWIAPIEEADHKPDAHVCLKDLDKPEGKCDALAACTDQVLEKNKPAQMAFVLAQKYNLEMRFSRFIPSMFPLLFDNAHRYSYGSTMLAIRRILVWHPHVWKYLSDKPVHMRYIPMDTVKLFLDGLVPPQGLSSEQELVLIVISTAIVADHCFWISKRSSEGAIVAGTLPGTIRSGINIFLAQRQEALVADIRQSFGDRQHFTLSVSERLISLVGDRMRQEKYTKLSMILTDLVLKHRLPQPHQPRTHVSPSADMAGRPGGDSTRRQDAVVTNPAVP